MQSQPTHNPDCTACGLPILRGMEVSLNRKLYHPGCAVRAAQNRRKDEQADDARRKAHYEGRTVPDPHTTLD